MFENQGVFHMEPKEWDVEECCWCVVRYEAIDFAVISAVYE